MSEAQTVPLDGDTDAARVAIRRAEAAQMKQQGLTWQQIADQLGYSSAGSAFNAVMPALRKQAQESLADLRDITNARLERVMVALWPAAIRGDVKAAGELRRYIADYRRHNGLDAPLQVQVDMNVDAARALLIERLSALLPETVEGQIIPDLPNEVTGPHGPESGTPVENRHQNGTDQGV